MASCTFRDATTIFDYGSPYFVAEVNTSHNGNVDTAKQMIDKAVEAGCSCVKFQSWSAESLYSKTYYANNPIAKRIVSKLSLNDTQLSELALYCKDQGISFSSTPYSVREVDFLLERCNVPYIKVASMDLNNYPYLSYIAKTNAPIVLSTGMSEIEEVRKAVQVIESCGNKNMCLLHCVSIYPPELATIHLNNIIGLRKAFPNYPIGFSDHTLGGEIAIASVALGAALVEKHLTLDRKKIGMDNQMATEPEEMAQMIISCRNVHTALGGYDRVVLQAEKEQLLKMRRSVVLTKDLPAGSVIRADDLDCKRPGTGLVPEKIYGIIGKTLTRDMEADTLLTEEDYH